MNAYLQQVLDDVKQFEEENYDVPVEDVEMLSFKRLLKEFLEWNGIIGYHNYIIELIKYALPVTEGDLEL